MCNATDQTEISRLVVSMTAKPEDKPTFPPFTAVDVADMDEAGVPTHLRPLAEWICAVGIFGHDYREAARIIGMVLRVVTEEMVKHPNGGGTILPGLRNAASAITLNRDLNPTE